MGARGTIAGRRGGFTLIELMVTLSVLSLVLIGMGVFQLRSNNASKSMLARSAAETRARRALDRVAEELTGVGHTLLFPDPSTSFGTSAITYQRSTGVSATGTVTWGTQSRLELELEPGETDNGHDDDGDGLVDERRLVLIRDFGTAAAKTVVLCSGVAELLEGETANGADDNGNGVVDEAGFNVRRVGDLLTARLTVLVPLGGERSTGSTLETSIVLRN
jgi:prepilin-type N-terminal cleavage/methylation domain-containing protein